MADTVRGLRLLETSHPPTYYLPQEDIAPGVLATGHGSSFCEWKGLASYLDVLVGDERLKAVAWTYLSPASAYDSLKNHVAFYAAPFDACFVDDERVHLSAWRLLRRLGHLTRSRALQGASPAAAAGEPRGEGGGRARSRCWLRSGIATFAPVSTNEASGLSLRPLPITGALTGRGTHGAGRRLAPHALKLS